MADKDLSIEKMKFIADLAMTELTEEELEKYQKQIESILSYVDKLREVETKDVELKSHVTWKNRLKTDEPRESLSQEDATYNRKGKSLQGYIVLKSGVKQDESAA
jgi:aspartyl-tRNA(Asn)/glutamyl-tRNA(Gln) amidotransferase subunit C